MKLLQRTTLYFQNEKSNKTYEVDLCEITEDQHTVNFRYGRIGGVLKEGTKTVYPISKEKALEVFNDLVSSKTKKGYTENRTDKAVSPIINKPDNKTTNLIHKHIRKHLTRYANGDSTNWTLSRVLWKTGIIKVSDIENILSQITHRVSSEMEIYTLVWALTRCGYSHENDFILHHHIHHKDPKVRKICQESLMASSQKNYDEFKSQIVTNLPDQLVISFNEPLVLQKQIEDLIFKLKVENRAFIYQLYLLSFRNENIKKAILPILKKLKPKVNNFKHIRAIYKAAELTEDHELLGLFSLQFDTIRSNSFYQNIQGDNYGVATNIIGNTYGTASRGYFRRRGFKTLEQLSNINADAYTDFAMNYLIAFDGEQHEIPAFTNTTYNWETRSYGYLNYKANSRYEIFNYVLYNQSLRYEYDNGKWLIKNESTADGIREEAHPTHWDEHPKKLIKILSKSNSEEVINFPIKALKSRNDLVKLLTVNDITSFIASSSPNVVQFGLDIIDVFLQQKEIEPLLAALIISSNEKANQIAITKLTESADLINNPIVLEALLLSKSESITEWRPTKVNEKAIDKANANLVISKIIKDWLTGELAIDNDLVKASSKFILNNFNQVLSQINFHLVADLLVHSNENLMAFGGQILAIHESDLTKIDPAILESLLNSKNEIVRAAGLSVLSRLDDKTLVNYYSVIKSMLTSDDEDVRDHIYQLTFRISEIEDYGTDMVQCILPKLRRTSSSEGLHAFFLELLFGPLKNRLSVIPDNQIFRYVSNSQIASQELAHYLLSERSLIANLNLNQQLQCAGATLLDLRKIAWNYFDSNVLIVKSDKEIAVKILDKEPIDTRDFAKSYFEKHYTKDDWTPDMLVTICDSVRPDVQTYAQRMITKYFRQEDGYTYLKKLSQHPSNNVQLLVTNYLANYATESPERIQELQPYFLTILTGINKGKVAKARILSFFESEIEKDISLAKPIGLILNKILPMITIGIHETTVRLLSRIKDKYPDIESPISEIEYEVRNI